MTSASEPKIPATIVTGFLGAGKTTLIRELIAHADRRIALIVNEFGDVGVDGELLRGCASPACAEEDIVELANGCICCTVADDFIPTMTALLARERRPEHIVIETSGLALPQPLVKAFGWPGIRSEVTVDGVIAVVDGEALANGGIAADEAALAAQRAADGALDHESPVEELFEDQLAAADMVVISKADLVGAPALAGIEARLRAEIRGGVGIVAAANGALPAALLVGLGAAAEDDLVARAGHHGEDEEHDHDDFAQGLVELGEVAGPEDLTALARAAIEGAGLYRLKGFAAVRGKDMRLVVQAVGPRVATHYDRPFAPGEARVTRLVAIGPKGLDADALARAFAGA